MPLDDTQAPHASTEETPAERSIRQLRLCRRIAELAMALAEAAAENAIQDIVEPPNPPSAPPSAKQRCNQTPPQSQESHEQALQRLQAETENLANPQNQTTSRAPRNTSAATLFDRLCRIVLAAIALENRIAAAAAQEAASRPTWRSPDPRRPALTRALHIAAARHPNAAALRRNMEDRLDEELEADPTATAAIIHKICRGYGIHINPNPTTTDPGQALYEILGTWPNDTG